MTSRHVTYSLGSLANQLGLLHITSLDPTFQRDVTEQELTLNFHPPELVAMESVRAIVEESNLSDVAIVYDETFGELFLGQRS